jgi:cytoskeletal protein RodZ
VTQDIARPLGEWLRQRREELGISLEQAEVETRIRRRYLVALETEDMDSLPDPFVGRGFLRNYAVYLGLDPAAAANRYAQIGAPPPPPVPPVDDSAFRADSFRPVPLHHMPGFRGRRRWVAGLVVIAVAAVALLSWQGAPWIYYWFNSARAALRPAATTPAVLATQESAAAPTLAITTVTPAGTRSAATATGAATDPATASPEPTLTLTWTPSPSPSPSPPVYTGIFMELVFTGTSWTQVTVDGVRDFQGVLNADTYRSWYGEERIELRIGNAGVVQVTVNGQSLGTLGAPGEVVDRVFERAGEAWAQVTPTITPTLEFTPQAPATATAVVRPTLPPTAAPTATIEPTAPISPTTGP